MILKRSYLTRVIFVILIAIQFLGFVTTVFAKQYFGITEYKKWPNSTISVCWEDPSGFFDEEKGWVKDSIVNTWQANSKLQLDGWNDCSDSSKGIRIRFNNTESPYAEGLGTEIDGFPDGVVLLSEFDIWKNSSKFGCCSSDGNKKRHDIRKHCIEWVAVHEFGHALAIPHEHNRIPTFKKTVIKSDGKEEERHYAKCEGNTLVRYVLKDDMSRRVVNNGSLEYDPESVMNYCYTHENMCKYPKLNIRLSKKDVLSLRNFYGYPDPSKSPRDAAREFAGYCKYMPEAVIIPHMLDAALYDGDGRFEELSGNCDIKGRLISDYPELSLDISDSQSDVDFLIYASGKGDLDYVTILLNRNIEPDAQNERGENALMYAAAYGHIEVVKKLLEKGADSASIQGQKAIIYALINGRSNIVKLFLKRELKGHDNVYVYTKATIERSPIEVVGEIGDVNSPTVIVDREKSSNRGSVHTETTIKDSPIKAGNMGNINSPRIKIGVSTGNIHDDDEAKEEDEL